MIRFHPENYNKCSRTSYKSFRKAEEILRLCKETKNLYRIPTYAICISGPQKGCKDVFKFLSKSVFKFLNENFGSTLFLQKIS